MNPQLDLPKFEKNMKNQVFSALEDSFDKKALEFPFENRVWGTVLNV